MNLNLNTFFSNYIINWNATHLTNNEKLCSKVMSIVLGIFTLAIPHLISLFYQKVIARSWDRNHSPTVQKVYQVFKQVFNDLSLEKHKIGTIDTGSLSSLTATELVKLYKHTLSEVLAQKDPAVKQMLQSSLLEMKDTLIRHNDLKGVESILVQEDIKDPTLLSAVDSALHKSKRSFVNSINDFVTTVLQKQVPNQKPRILHVSLEFTKAKVGGVGTVTESLLAKSRDADIDARIVTPFYDFYQKDPEYKDAKFKGFVDHLFDGKKVRSSIYKIWAQDNKVPQYLIKPDPAYSQLFAVGSQTSIYDIWFNSSVDERDLYMASAVASMAACYKSKGIGFQPKNIDIVQIHNSCSMQIITKLLNDVQNPLREQKNLAKIHSVIHYHDGIFTKKSMWSSLTSHKLKGIGLTVPNGTKNSVALSWNNTDAVVLVADEMIKKSLNKIENPYSFEINNHLNNYQRLKGITNGINHKQYDITNAETYGRFAILPQKGVETDYLAEKAKIKEELFEAGVIADPLKPLFFFVGRLHAEKGIDMLPTLVEELHKLGGQCVVMGTQFDYSPSEVSQLKEFAIKHPETLKVYTNRENQTEFFKDTKVSKGHLIRAAGDFCMVPSHDEPCGLVPFETTACGNITFTSYTGGLKDVCRGMGHLDPQGNLITEDNFDAFTYEHGPKRKEDAKAKLKFAFDFYKDLKENNPDKLNQIIGRIIENSRRSDWLTPTGAVDKFKAVYKIAMTPRTEAEEKDRDALRRKWGELV